MIRDVKLIDYLPSFIQEYREIQKIMEIENNVEDGTTKE